MFRYGLLEPWQAKAVLDLVKIRGDFAWTVKGFADNNLRMAQSINRITEEIYDMAQKAKKAIARQQQPASEFTWKGFVDCKLSDVDKGNFAAWDVADSDVWDGIATYCESGVKISVTYNKQNASFNCAGTGQPSSGENSGYCVTAHAKTPYDACRVWLYKVAVVLPQVWNEYEIGDAESFG